MGVFDDVRSILSEINAKLGPAAPERAAEALSQPPTQPTQKKENAFEQRDQARNLETAIFNAFNRIPVFGQISRAFSGLSQISRDIFSTTAATFVASKALRGGQGEPPIGEKLFGKEGWENVKDEMSPLGRVKKFAAYYPSLWKQKLSLWMLHRPGEDISDNFKKDGQDTPRSKKMKEDYDKRMDSWMRRVEKIYASGPSLNPFKIFGTRNLIENLFKLPGDLAGRVVPGAGIGFGTLLKFGGGVVAATSAIIKFAKSLVDADRKISIYNPQTAIAWTLNDINSMILDMISARKRGAEESRFLASWAGLESAWRPVWDEIVGDFAFLGTQLVDVTLKLMEWGRNLVPKIPEIAAKVDAIPLNAVIAVTSVLPRDKEGNLTGKGWLDWLPSSGAMDFTKKENADRLKQNPIPNIKEDFETKKSDKFLDGDSPLAKIIRQINDNLKILVKLSQDIKGQGEIMGVGEFMAGVINDPHVYDPHKDRAFDYTNKFTKVGGR